MPAVTALIINRLITHTRSTDDHTHGYLLTINLQHRISSTLSRINVGYRQVDITLTLIGHLLHLITTVCKNEWTQKQRREKQRRCDLFKHDFPLNTAVSCTIKIQHIDSS